MILSNDSILKPPYTLNSEILRLVTRISEKIGTIQALFLVPSSPKLRKQNQIKTIHASLSIEGNTLTAEQITAVIENKRVLGPKRDIIEVENAIAVYAAISDFKYDSIPSFLKAHRILLQNLIPTPGSFRTKNVGIVKGSQVEHLAPPAEKVPNLMNELFSYLQDKEELVLIKSCVFHYEMEFIHPFIDGNGRMGRLWQTLILMTEYPVFQHIPFETLIAEDQEAYYAALANSDKAGNSTAFVTYMLELIDRALEKLLKSNAPSTMTQEGRLEHFCSITEGEFTRKDYMQIFRNLSSASASRDLKAGVENGLFTKSGDKRLTRYHIIR